MGTGFFLKLDDRVFLVSADHVFTGFDGWDKYVNTQKKYKYLVISVPLTNGKRELYVINASKSLKNAVRIDYRTYGDIFADELVNFPKNADIHFLNPYLYSSSPDDNLDSLVAFGFGLTEIENQQFEKNDLENRDKFFADALQGSTIKKYFSKVTKNPPVGEDANINKIFDSLYISCQPGADQGSSGSPVFSYKMDKITGKYKIKFAGIICASGTTGSKLLYGIMLRKIEVKKAMEYYFKLSKYLRP